LEDREKKYEMRF